jgi:capsular exopolysaccharide synthesis family protein
MAELVTATRLIDPTAGSAEAFRSLHLALQLRHTGEGGAVCIITSAEPAVGKSTIAANLAVVAAYGASRVLLIDADLRRPVLHEMFGVPRAPGLVDFLAAGKSLRTFIQKSEEAPSGLDIVPAGRPVAITSDITAWPRLGAALGEAAKHYDLVILDSAPLLVAPDTEAIAGYSSSEVVFVIGPESRRRNVVRALRRLDLMEAHVTGLVLNREGHQIEYGY